MKISGCGRFIATACIALLSALGPSHAAAADDVVIGQVVPLTGLFKIVAEDYLAGGQAYFASINAAGGINGRKIRLVVKDDANLAEKSLQLTLDLISQEDPVALYGYIGTPNVLGLLKNNVLADAGIALLGPWSGAPELREPNNPNLFHIRASSADETARMVEQLYTLGIRRIAMLYQDDPFGRAGLAGAQGAMSKKGGKLLVSVGYPRTTPEDMEGAAATIARENPDAVILAATSVASSAFARKLRATGSRARLFNMSSVSFKSLLQNLGEDMARGIGIAQVMPFPYAPTTPVAREFQEAMAKHNPTARISHASMESFVAAKVLAEAIRRAGPKPNRQKVLAALNQMKSYDAGGFRIGFTPDDHRGSNFVEITVIGQGGKLMH